MDNILEVLTLLRRQTVLERNLLNGSGADVTTEHDLEATRRRLAAHPQALNAVLHTARALRRTPDAISAQDVADWGFVS
jgi:hypothetical protein